MPSLSTELARWLWRGLGELRDMISEVIGVASLHPSSGLFAQPILSVRIHKVLRQGFRKKYPPTADRI